MTHVRGALGVAFAAVLAACAVAMTLVAMTTGGRAVALEEMVVEPSSVGVPQWRYEMRNNDKMGIKPLCTHITSMGGMTEPDCIEGIPEVGAEGGGAGAGQGDYWAYHARSIEPSNCDQVCHFCRTSVMSGYSCARCDCKLWPAPLARNPVDDFLGYGGY